MNESVREMLAREAEEAEARADAELRGDVQPAQARRGRKPADDPTQVYAIRIPVSRLQQLRELAESVGETPSGLIRRWVLDHLDSAHGGTDTPATGPGDLPDQPGPLSDRASGVVNLGVSRQSNDFVDAVEKMLGKRARQHA